MENESLQREYDRLRHAVEELAFLNDLSLAIGSSYNSEEIMRTIVRKSIRALNVEQGSITLVDDSDEQEMKTLVRTMVSHGDHKPFSINQSLLGWMHINKKPIFIDDPEKDDRFSGMGWEGSMKSVACVPLMVKSHLTGILSVYNKKTAQGFDDDDLRLLSIIASQSAQIVENARLYEEEKAFFKLREQARLAGEIQKTLLPKSNPDIPGFDIAGKSVPALSVGGDYYDFIPLDNGNTVICLGDISGKGMPAALLMSNLQATIRGQAIVDCVPKNCVRRSNSLLYKSTESNKYATFFYGLLNADENKFCYTNAGHNPPVLLKKNMAPELMEKGGPILGFLNNIDYLDDTILLEKGDLICIFSDGITEAMDTFENEYGEEKLTKFLVDNRDKPSKVIIDGIIAEVNFHSKDVPQSDDITIIVIKKD